MAQFTIGLSPENSKYLNVMSRITGLSYSALINRAVDMKRDFDNEFMTGFNSLLEKFDIPSAPSRRATFASRTFSADEYADSISKEVEDIEKSASDDLMDDFNDDDYLRKKLTEMKRQATR